MAKFYGIVGYVKTEESTASSVWEDVVTEKTYFGDFVRDSRRWEGRESLHDNVVFNNSISIIADDYATKNLGYIKYVIVEGQRVEVKNIELRRPRIILTLGGLYNGPLPKQA